MSNYSKRVPFWAVMFLAFSATAMASSPGVLISAGAGTVIAGQGPVKSGAPVTVGARLQTPVDASAQLRISDGTMVMIAPKSDIGISAYEFNAEVAQPRYGQVSIESGQARFVTGAISKSAPGQFSALTPFGLVTAYGTDFVIAMCNAACASALNILEGAYIAVYDGRVIAAGRLGSAELTIGQVAVLTVGGAVVLLDRLPDGLLNVPEPIVIPIPSGGIPYIPNPPIIPAEPVSPAS